jgi:hypothetical protein
MNPNISKSKHNKKYRDGNFNCSSWTCLKEVRKLWNLIQVENVSYRGVFKSLTETDFSTCFMKNLT